VWINAKDRAERTTTIGIAEASLWVGTRMAVEGHGHAMTIADYSALGVLIVLAMWAALTLYLRGKL
jgi:hypothetical protein